MNDEDKTKEPLEKPPDGEEQFQLFFEEAPLPYQSLDSTGRFLAVNQAWLSTLGYLREDVIGKRFLDFIAPEEIELFKKRFPVFQANGTTQTEFEMVRTDGLRIPMKFTGRIAYDENGFFKRTHCILEDITERKQAEKERKESETRFSSVIDNTQAGYFHIDRNGCFKHVNDAWLLMHRYTSAEEIIGKHFSTTQVGTDLQHAQDIVEGSLQGAPIPSGEFSRLCKDGSIGFHTFTIIPVEKDGEIVGLEGFLIDTTGRKQAEEQLRHSQLLASLGMMTAGIAHEVGNPLASILLYTEVVMKDKGISKQTKKDLEVIRSEAQRAGALMKNLLTYSRKIEPYMQVTNIHGVIKKAVGMLKYQLNVQNINLKTNLSKRTLNVNGDAVKLTQVFLNLIINASDELKGAGEGNITISSEVDGEWIKVAVRDDGPGIPEEFMSQIFIPFFTTKDIGEGTGLGLSICYGIVTSHNGTITAENNEDGGATFTVTLPLQGKAG